MSSSNSKTNTLAWYDELLKGNEGVRKIVAEYRRVRVDLLKTANPLKLAKLRVYRSDEIFVIYNLIKMHRLGDSLIRQDPITDAKNTFLSLQSKCPSKDSHPAFKISPSPI
jgi:hypothetical protein